MAMTALSGTAFGYDFDGRPYGATVSPWPIPQCPSNGFVLYRDDFSKTELARLRQYVESEKYRALAKSETTYYLAAHLQRYLGAPDAETAPTLLQATWQASPQQYVRYAGEAIQAHKALCVEGAAIEQSWLECQMIVGELERRLGMFDSSAVRFRHLKQIVRGFAFKEESDGAYLRQVIAAQLRLIGQGNTDSSRLERNK